MTSSLAAWLRRYTAPSRAVLDHRITTLEHRQELLMSLSSDAYARLDNEIEALRDYVNNDDATDAAEVDRRADNLKELLNSVAPADADSGSATSGDDEDNGPAPVA